MNLGLLATWQPWTEFQFFSQITQPEGLKAEPICCVPFFHKMHLSFWLSCLVLSVYSLSFSVCPSVSLSSLSAYLILCPSISHENALSYCFFNLVEQILELVFNIKSSLFQQKLIYLMREWKGNSEIYFWLSQTKWGQRRSLTRTSQTKQVDTVFRKIWLF